MKVLMEGYNSKLRAAKTNSLKQPYRNGKKAISSRKDYSTLQEVARSYSDYRPMDNIFQVGKLIKTYKHLYANNFGFAQDDHAKAVVTVEIAFGLLYQLCRKFFLKSNVNTICNKVLRDSLPATITGINNNLVIYFLESLCRASDLPLSSRQMVVGTEVYMAIKSSGGFGLSQFVLTPDRKGDPLHPKLAKVTKALHYTGDFDQVIKEINQILVSHGQEPITEMTRKEYSVLIKENKKNKKKKNKIDTSDLSQKFREELSAVKLINEFDNEEDDSDKENFYNYNLKTSEQSDNTNSAQEPGGSEQSDNTNSGQERGSEQSDNHNSGKEGGSDEQSDNNEEEKGSEESGDNPEDGEGSDEQSDNNEEDGEGPENSENNEEPSGNNPEEGGGSENSENNEEPTDLQILKGQLSTSETKMRHVILNVFTYNIDNLPEQDSRRKDHYVLVVQCVLTKFTLFIHINVPYNLNEIASKLCDICGWTGVFHTVTYYKDGMCFNRERYFHNSTNQENIIFDNGSPFGVVGYELSGQMEYLLMIHNSIFKNSLNNFFDSKDSTVFLNIHPSEHTINHFIKKYQMFLSIMFRNYENLSNDEKSTRQPFGMYSSTQFEVNTEDKLLYGASNDIEQRRLKRNIRSRSSYERLFNQSYNVQESSSESFAYTLHHIVDVGGIIDDGFKDYRSDADDNSEDDEDKIIFELINQDAKEKFGLPASKTPKDFGIVSELLLSPENVQKADSPGRLKSWTELYDFSKPVGLYNPGTFCFENAVFRMILGIPQLLKQIETFISKMLTKHNEDYLCTHAYLCCAILFCGFEITEISKDKFRTSEKRVYDCRILRNALITKAKRMNEDAIEAKGNNDAVEAMSFILNYVFEEFKSFDKAFATTNAKHLDDIVKNNVTHRYHCETHNMDWDRTESVRECHWVTRFDAGPLLDEGGIQRFEHQFQITRENYQSQEELIHLHDLCKLDNKLWDDKTDHRCSMADKGYIRNRNIPCCTTTRKEMHLQSSYYFMSITRARGMQQNRAGNVIGAKTKFGVIVPYLLEGEYSLYQLKSAILHYGSGTVHGHYVVCMQDKHGVCLKISDAKTSEISEVEYCRAINFHAVLLCYQRIRNESLNQRLRHSQDGYLDPLRPKFLNSSEPQTEYKEYQYQRDYRSFGPYLEQTLLKNEDLRREEEALATRMSLRSRMKSSSSSTSSQKTLTQFVRENDSKKRKHPADDKPVSVSNKKPTIIEVNDTDDDSDSIAPPEDDDELAFDANFSTDRILNKLFDIEIHIDTTKEYKLLTSGGYGIYKPGVETQPCLFCEDFTPHKIGKISHVCEKCRANNSIVASMKLKESYQKLQKLQLQLSEHCFKCCKRINFKKNYHVTGGFLTCHECYANGECSCVTCLSGVGNIKEIRDVCTEIRREALKRSNDFDVKLSEYKSKKAVLSAQSKQNSSENREVKLGIFMFGYKGRIFKRYHDGYSKKEKTLFELLQNTETPLLNQIRGNILKTSDIVSMLPQQKSDDIFTLSEMQVVPEEVIKFYAKMLGSLNDLKPYTKLTVCDKTNVGSWMSDLVQNGAHERKQKHVYFVTRKEENNPAHKICVYFFDFDHIRSVKLTYFDPSQSDKEVYNAWLQAIWKEKVVEPKSNDLSKGLTIVSDYTKIFGGGKASKMTFDYKNNYVYATMFLFNVMRRGNDSDAKVVVIDKYIDAMKTHIAMASILGMPQWF